MIRIAVCDDDTDSIINNQIILKNCLSRLKALAEIQTYNNGKMLLNDILEDNSYYDLILLDIEMPDISGMEIVQAIKPALPNVKVIFITSHVKYAIDSFELSIFRYVPKNDLDKRLTYAVTDALKLIMLEDDKSYTVLTANRMEKVRYSDILYILRDGKNAALHTYHGIIKVRKSLLTVCGELESEEFIFIERGCIINLIHLTQIKNSSVYLRDGTILPISRSHLQDVKMAVNSYWGKHI
ncbi:Transcriptional regulatory protein NatR [Blautia producta]|uniref:Stage 0 sporulation protein A homolog n=1 Tax=Blautia producta TaxID=33035 RepID=A0A4P6M122_9FIRM|nr:LytTR family DNA-binding domain-containing protein [Blautia producta]QBE97280.1 Transcriptional regulatory protein NatR [Blautia producta]